MPMKCMVLGCNAERMTSSFCRFHDSLIVSAKRDGEVCRVCGRRGDSVVCWDCVYAVSRNEQKATQAQKRAAKPRTGIGRAIRLREEGE